MSQGIASVSNGQLLNPVVPLNPAPENTREAIPSSPIAPNDACVSGAPRGEIPSSPIAPKDTCVSEAPRGGIPSSPIAPKDTCVPGTPSDAITPPLIAPKDPRDAGIPGEVIPPPPVAPRDPNIPETPREVTYSPRVAPKDPYVSERVYENPEECVVCMDAKPEIVLIPCGHNTLCAKCALIVPDTCPTCRAHIDHFTLRRK